MEDESPVIKKEEVKKRYVRCAISGERTKKIMIEISDVLERNNANRSVYHSSLNNRHGR